MSLDKGLSSKVVYLLSEELKNDPEQVSKAQALTLDDTRQFGLKGSHGLFGSEEWWKNIDDGILPLKKVSGVISRLYVAGQDTEEDENEFVLNLDDGREHIESIFANKKADEKLFKVGARVDIVYVLDELKTNELSEIVLEMAVTVN